MCEDRQALQSMRQLRSTAVVYDEAYWKRMQKRHGTAYTMQDPQAKIENEKKAAWIKSILHLETGSLLDVGCSFGLFVAYMRTCGWDSYGVDISEYAISQAPFSVKDRVQVASAAHIPFADNSFELVTCFDILEHLYIEEIFAVVAEVERVAAKFILIRCPMKSYRGEREIADESYRSEEISHISIYPWEFWCNRFTEHKKFTPHTVMLWPGWSEDKFEGESVEGWIFFKRK